MAARSDMELVGQGVANIFSPIFGGIPATGAIARTATNIKNGGRTPVAGMVHAFLRRMAEVSQASYITDTLNEEEVDDPNALNKRVVPDGVEVFEINGPFFFGAADKFKSALQQVHATPRVLVVRLRHVLALDATGLRALEDILAKSRREGTTLVLSGVHAQPLVAMQRAGLLDLIGEDNVTGHIDDALDRACEILGLPPAEHPGPFVPSVTRDQDRDETVNTIL